MIPFNISAAVFIVFVGRWSSLIRRRSSFLGHLLSFVAVVIVVGVSQDKHRACLNMIMKSFTTLLVPPKLHWLASNDP